MESKYYLSFTLAELDLILGALNELPRKTSDELFRKIVSEFNRQMKENEKQHAEIEGSVDNGLDE